MTPIFAIIHAEGIAGENFTPNRVFVKTLKGFTATMARAFHVHCPQIPIVLARIVFAPDGGVNRVFVYLYHPEYMLGGLLFTLSYIPQQKHDACCGYSYPDNS